MREALSVLEVEQKESVEHLRIKDAKEKGFEAENEKVRGYTGRNVCFIFMDASSYWYYFLQLN